MKKSYHDLVPPAMPPKLQTSKRVKRASHTGDSDDSYTDDSGLTHRASASKNKRLKVPMESQSGRVQSNEAALSNDTAPLIEDLQFPVKEHKKAKEDLDKYCKMCDDGGDLLECDRCGFSYCYDEKPSLQVTEDHEHETDQLAKACISVPPGYTLDPFTVFYCPQCLTEQPALRFDYQINRGFNSTQRRTINFQVIMLLCYLPELADRAKRIDNSIRSLLGAFEIVTIAMFLPLPDTLHKSNRNWILELEHPYHLVFLFLTESNPGGGWWIGENSHTDEAQWLSGLVGLYTDIAEKAVTARIFGLCCGLNLNEKKTVPEIIRGLSNSHWDSIMLPTASSLLPEEFAIILPELFGQLYYNGVGLATATVRVWATSQRARIHTDVLLIEGLHETPTVRKYRYGSLSSRPYAIDLPAPWTFCKCAREILVPKWKRKDGSVSRNHSEFLVRYKTSCNHAHLDLAICTGNAYIRQAAGVQILVEDFDYQKGAFPLDEAGSVCMRIYLRPKLDAVHKGVDHSSAWTTHGQLAEAARAALELEESNL